jgi:phage shock protein PspC (stress-responsive transcriptional regulator)
MAPRPEKAHTDRVNTSDLPLRRNTRDGRIGGVASGIADHLRVDPTVVRLAFALLAFVGGAGLLAYLIAWAVIPADNESAGAGALDRLGPGPLLAGVGLAAIGAILLIDHPFPWVLGGGNPWPLLLIVAGVALLLWRRSAREDIRASVSPAVEVPVSENEADTTATYVLAESQPPVRDLPAAPEPLPARRYLPLTWITAGILAACAGVAVLLDGTGAFDVTPTRFLVFALSLTSAALVATAWVGRPGGLVALGIVLAVSLAAATAIHVPPWAGIGEQIERPRSVAELGSSYELGAGRLVLDLRAVDLDGGTRTIEADVGVGELVVLLPRGIAAQARSHVSIGHLELFGSERGGIDIGEASSVAAVAPEFEGERGTFDLDLEVGVGSASVGWD